MGCPLIHKRKTILQKALKVNQKGKLAKEGLGEVEEMGKNRLDLHCCFRLRCSSFSF
jgi:hypothetical protein